MDKLIYTISNGVVKVSRNVRSRMYEADSVLCWTVLLRHQRAKQNARAGWILRHCRLSHFLSFSSTHSWTVCLVIHWRLLVIAFYNASIIMVVLLWITSILKCNYNRFCFWEMWTESLVKIVTNRVWEFEQIFYKRAKDVSRVNQLPILLRD